MQLENIFHRMYNQVASKLSFDRIFIDCIVYVYKITLDYE